MHRSGTECTIISVVANARTISILSSALGTPSVPHVMHCDAVARSSMRLENIFKEFLSHYHNRI